MMQLGDKFEYLVQMVIKSKRTENSYELTKIGCYPYFEPVTADDYRKENKETIKEYNQKYKEENKERLMKKV